MTDLKGRGQKTGREPELERDERPWIRGTCKSNESCQQERTRVTNDRNDVPLTSVGQLAVDSVDDRSKKNSVDKTDVEEGGRMVLVNTGVDHLGDADRRRNGSESL
jgi:hypothetical protein